MEERKKILQLSKVEVEFKVRGRILTAIRGVDLDIYEGESIAIVGESGSGKSVLTKTFSGMLDSNGYVSNGSIIYDDPELSETYGKKTALNLKIYNSFINKLNEYSKYEYGVNEHKEIVNFKKEIQAKVSASIEEEEAFKKKINDLEFDRVEKFNYKQTLDSKKDANEIEKIKLEIKEIYAKEKKLSLEFKKLVSERANAYKLNQEEVLKDKQKLQELNEKFEKAINVSISDEQKKRNELIAKELILSIARYPFSKKFMAYRGLLKAYKNAMIEGLDIYKEEVRDEICGSIAFRVKFLDETNEEDCKEKETPKWHGYCRLDLAKFKLNSDWNQIRGAKIATIFQDPMTSLNPIIKIGKQITDCILKHQDLTVTQARHKAIKLMKLVGIPNPEKRFDDYPFQYSGGMRQRIVIAIALSCEPRILICDEPTTALDVTIQAQIIRLIKDLQRKLGYTIVFITHDLGVVANVADRVAVLYAGQVVEVGKVEEVFYDPRHPYTWSLLSSLPQLSTRGEELFSITGTPPSLYNKIKGDPFAPRNPYRMAIDYVKEPPMFKVSDTHYAKTWLLDPRAPKVEKPQIIQDIHNKLSNTVYGKTMDEIENGSLDSVESEAK